MNTNYTRTVAVLGLVSGFAVGAVLAIWFANKSRKGKGRGFGVREEAEEDNNESNHSYLSTVGTHEASTEATQGVFTAGINAMNQNTENSTTSPPGKMGTQVLEENLRAESIFGPAARQREQLRIRGEVKKYLEVESQSKN